LTWLRWWYRRWRARHRVWLAYLDWYNQPTQSTRNKWKQANDYLRSVENLYEP
jgi:hypothetical protein